MATLSIVTPLHSPGVPFVRQAYESILRAGEGFDGEWEWIVLENNGGRLPHDLRKDPRVRVVRAPNALRGVGALKRLACASATGDVFVELDADDELAPGALTKITQAFDAGADFVYSDFAEFRDLCAESSSRLTRWDAYPYGSAYGWRHYPVTVEGCEYLAMRATPVTAHNLRLVDWAPNHVRAWRRSAYEEVGGHDATLVVADDHDLAIRFFLAGKQFKHIPECLYLYRVHAKNTVGTRNAQVRAATWRNYERYIWRLAEKWAADRGLATVDVCGAHGAPAGYAVLDRTVEPFPDLDERWPLADDSVGVLRAHDAIEHLRDPIHTMNEAYRVLAPGGFLMISVPSSDGKGAFADPTHKSYWNDLSFRYYTDRNFARYIPAFKGRFQVLRVLHWFPSEWRRENNVPYVEAHLVALKPGYEPMGEVLWSDPPPVPGPPVEHPTVATETADSGSMLGRWAPWYSTGHRACYGPSETYALAEEWLGGLAVEDWGCGYANFKRFHTGGYRGIDGTAGWADHVADLRTYQSQTDGLLLRHVLEHNHDWRDVLKNAVASFQKRMVLVVFTPDAGRDEKVLAHVAAVNVDDLALPHTEIESFFDQCRVLDKRFFPTATGYGGETVWLVER